MTDYKILLEQLQPVMRSAGGAILDVYRSGIIVETKADGSPVTEADQRAERIILDGLKRHAPEIPVVSEENAASHTMDAPQRYFLVDPLDGTKEFLRKDGLGNFTVNIGLIENGIPTLGLIYVPTSDQMFCGAPSIGATENGVSIQVRAVPGTGPVALTSRSHKDAQTNDWLSENSIRESVAIGSSIKFCVLASGEADFYPRYGPTMEWDVAAGHAILNAAGGQLTQFDGTQFNYGKPGYKNGPFLAQAAAAPGT